jgi:nitric oxide reductase NorQ protein
MITFDLDEHDRETEIGIVANRARLAKEQAAPIVDLVRALRRSGLPAQSPSLRSAIMIARIAAHQGLAADGSNPAFAALCRDVLFSKAPGGAQPERRRAYSDALDKAIAGMGAAPARTAKGRAA